MKFLRFLTFPLLALAAPVAAQTTPPAAPPAKTTLAPPSDDHVAAAQPVIDKLWPLGTYRKMMDGQMSEMMDAMMASMFDMKAEDLVPAKDVPESEKGKSLGDIAAEKDPHFRERFRIMMDVTFKEMAPIMDKAEPAIRTALTNDYARRYTPTELRDLDRFLTTPTGKTYAQNWVLSFYSPEMLTSMKGVMPEIIQAMPAIMEKVEKATAHLPPLSKPESEDPVAEDAVAEDAVAELAAVDAVEEADGENDNIMSKWSAADQKLGEELRMQVATFSDKEQIARSRYELHTLDAKERTGQKLTIYEIDNRNYLREYLKDKK